MMLLFRDRGTLLAAGGSEGPLILLEGVGRLLVEGYRRWIRGINAAVCKEREARDG